MKILLSDAFDPSLPERLTRFGEVTQNKEEVPGCEIVLVRSKTKVTKEYLDNAKSLKYVIRGGVGLDNIDLKYCAEKGIKVFNAPGSNAASVAEHVVMVALAVLRNLNACQKSVRAAGAWGRFELAGNELMGKTVGIIGLGAIGRHLVPLLRSRSR